MNVVLKELIRILLKVRHFKEYQQVTQNRQQMFSKFYSCRIFRGEGELIIFDTINITDVVLTSVVILQHIYSRCQSEFSRGYHKVLLPPSNLSIFLKSSSCCLRLLPRRPLNPSFGNALTGCP